ncbi:hypothetical protein BX667DRAFT_376034 [Coemansia mojavensis]|nr:hypothetical protein BX667DRAFT_376034 [Coemansia mojavensis]
MPPLASTTYIQQLAKANSGKAVLFNECLEALDKVGIRTDYDLLLQSDVLQQTPSKLHPHIRTMRWAVLEHFSSAGNTAADLLNAAAASPHIEIRCGIGPLDELLGSSVSGGKIVEICGKETGVKTWLSIEYATAHLTDKSHCQVKPTRVLMLLSSSLALWQVEKSLARRFKDRPKEEQMTLFRQAMERLIIVNCNDLDSLLSTLFHYANGGYESGQFSDLLVIDSIRPLVLNAIHQSNNGDVAIHAIKTALCEITDITRTSPPAVLITNGISRHGKNTQLDYHNVQPSLGSVWALVSHVHIYVYPKDEDTEYINATVLKSPDIVVGKTLTILNAGCW